MTWRTVIGGVAVMWFVTAVACGSSDDEDDISPRTCRNGDPCSEGAECSFSGSETGVNCHCDPSGHFFCDPHGGGGAPPWEPCTEDDRGACSGAATSCTETNGWCTRTCACDGACEMVCEGESAANVDRSALCDASYCDSPGYGSCEFHDGECDYKVSCGVGEDGDKMTGSCP